jgi:hypothetical protein
MALPRTLNETWQAVAASDILALTISRNGSGGFDVTSLYRVRRQSDSAVVKTATRTMPLPAGTPTTSLTTFVTTHVLPDINASDA